MRVVNEPPVNYGVRFSLDLRKDKKQSAAFNLIGLALMLLICLPMNFRVPLWSLFDTGVGAAGYFARLGLLVLLYVAFDASNKKLRAVLMRYFGAKEVKERFVKPFTYYIKCPESFDGYSFYMINMIPLFIHCAALTVLCVTLPAEWIWVPYLTMALGVSGSVAEIYTAFYALNIKTAVLVGTRGSKTTVYAKNPSVTPQS